MEMMLGKKIESAGSKSKLTIEPKGLSTIVTKEIDKLDEVQSSANVCRRPAPLRLRRRDYIKLSEEEWNEFEKLHTQSMKILSSLEDLKPEIELTFSISHSTHLDMLKDYDKREKLAETENEGDFHIAADLLCANCVEPHEERARSVLASAVACFKQGIKVQRYILKEMYQSSRWRRRAVILELLFRSNVVAINTLLEVNARNKAEQDKKEQIANIQKSLAEENTKLKATIEDLKIHYKEKLTEQRKTINSTKRENVILIAKQ